MILIDRPMPEACNVCPCMYDYIQCTALKDNEHESLSACDDYTKRQEWCPLKEVVQCKDCKHGGLDFFGVNGYWCSAHAEWHAGNWFCADGKQKDT